MNANRSGAALFLLLVFWVLLIQFKCFRQDEVNREELKERILKELKEEFQRDIEAKRKLEKWAKSIQGQKVSNQSDDNVIFFYNPDKFQ